MSRLAEHTSHCAADCGRLIRGGRDQYEMVTASGDHATAHIHVDCLDLYEQKLNARQKPVRNAPQSARVATEIVEHQCERCGADYAGRRGDVADRCRVLAYQLAPAIRATLDDLDGICGGRLVPVGEDPPATSAADAGESRSLEGSAEPVRTLPVGSLRRLDPQAALDVDSSPSKPSSPSPTRHPTEGRG